MTRPIRGFLVIAVLGFVAPVSAGDVDINVNLGSHPPPPVIAYSHEPEVVLIPDTRVYYAPQADYDFYRYGSRWYVNRDGYWYRAKTYRGPFLPLSFEGVPRVIIGVPREYRRHPAHPHGGPPGQMKKHGIDAHGRGHGHGKGGRKH